MIDELKKYGEVLENVSLKNYNTYKIGGNAEYLIYPDDISKLTELMKYIKDNDLKYFVIGNGSNLVLSDKLFAGIMIKLDKLNKITFQDDIVTCESGVMLPKLVMECVNNNLGGLEWASGIPGTVGGSLVGNAGAYKACMFDFVENITILDQDLKIKTITKDDINYEYRHTDLKEKKDIIVLAVTLKLFKGDKEESLAIINRRREKRLATQPLEYPSAGSVFRNPLDDAAGRIIEVECGLKGKKIGGAEVSTKHANFIINTDNATSNDVKDLIELVHDSVLDKTGIDLIVEQEFINWE